MEALICDCCNGIFMTENGNTLCEICTELENLRMKREELIAFIDSQLETSRKFVMEYIGNVNESNNYHYHLGQAAALQELKNVLFIQEM